MGAIAQGRHAEAVPDLRRSRSLCEVPATTFNLAIALRGTGDDVGAASLLTDLLQGELAAAQREQVIQLRDEIAAHMGVVRIRVTPRIAFEVRGVPYPAGTIAEVPLNVGPQRLVVSADGFEPQELGFQVRAGAALTADIELARPDGWLELFAADPRTTLEILGVASLRGERLRRQLAPGSYELRSRLDGTERRESADLAPGATLRFDMSVEPASFDWGLALGITGVVLAVLAVGAVALAWGIEESSLPTTDPTWGRIDLD